MNNEHEHEHRYTERVSRSSDKPVLLFVTFHTNSLFYFSFLTISGKGFKA